MVLLGLLLIVLLAGVLARRPAAERPAASVTSPPPDANESPRHPAARGSSRPATVLLAGAFLATIAAQYLGRGAEEEIVAAAPIEDIPLRLGRWDGADVPVPEEVRELLTADAILHREYRDIGYEVSVGIYWSSRIW